MQNYARDGMKHFMFDADLSKSFVEAVIKVFFCLICYYFLLCFPSFLYNNEWSGKFFAIRITFNTCHK